MTTFETLPNDECPNCAAIPGEVHAHDCPRVGAHFEVRLVRREPSFCNDCRRPLSRAEADTLIDLCEQCAVQRVFDIPPGC